MSDSTLINDVQRKRRISYLAVGIALASLIYTVNLFLIQVSNNDLYQNRATRITQRPSSIVAKRGEIYDRKADYPLVLNVDSFSVLFNPAEAGNIDYSQLFDRVAPILNLRRETLDRRVPPNLRSSYVNLELKSGVGLETIGLIAEQIENYPGISWTSKPVRNYLAAGSFSHVLGYVGAITEEELQVLFNQGYTNASILGKAGVERRYDLALRGRDGTRFRTVDAAGRRVESASGFEEIPPVIGNDLILTIDREIQTLAEKALGSRLGSVVVLKPETGEILALVSFPSFDPNAFYSDEASQVFSDLSRDRRFPFLNRTIQATYPPASTFKVIVEAAALEERLFDPSRRIVCNGHFELGDRVFNCHKKTGHGALNMQEALAQSCNVYFYTVGHQLGSERIAEYAREFGLGRPSGVDIQGEVSGLVPNARWKERTLNYPWLGGDTVNMSIGQGFTEVTPLQMANAMALIVNGGTIYKPHLVKEIRNPLTGETVESFAPEILHESDISAATFDTLGRDLRAVVTQGTANVVITTKAVQVAGKTGTGEAGIKGTNNNHSWFVSYAPYNEEDLRERVVVVVQVEAANDWEWWAPKAADIIYQGIFANQSYEEAVAALRPWYLR